MKSSKIILPLYSNACRWAMSIGGSFFKRVLVQNYSLESISLKTPIIQKLRLLHSCSKEIALCYISQLLTVNFSLKGKNRNTPDGWGYLVIGS